MASCIRPYVKKIWQNDKIEVCCRQETLLFIKEECLSSNAFLRSECEKTNKEQILIVHTEYYTRICLNMPPLRHFHQILFIMKDYLILKVKRIVRILPKKLKAFI